MNSKLSWDGKMGFSACGDSGHLVKIDVNTENGGQDSGARPMELILHGLGGCSGADVVSIIKKMKMDLQSLTIEITGKRAEDHPRRFTDIHLIYRFSGTDIDPEKAKRAIELSHTKYCSVAGSLNANLTYELVIERTA